MALTKVSGSVLKNPLSLSGNVSVGGTLTYEDVTNVDAIGIITARSNIDCNGDLDVDGHTNLDNVSIAGVTTITRTGGNGLLKVERASGAGLHIQAQTALGVFGTTSNHNLRFISNGNERMLLSTNGNVGINESSPSHKLVIGGDIGIGFNTPNDAGRQLNFNVNRSSAGDTLANINWQWNSKYVAQIRGIAGSDTTNKDDAHLAFFTSSANNLLERLRIDSAGRLLLNTTTTYVSNQIMIVKGASPSGGGNRPYDGQLAIESSETNGAINTGGVLAFIGHSGSGSRGFGSIRCLKEDGTSGNYGSYMSFETRTNGSAPAEKLRIGSSGQIGLGGENYGTSGQFLKSTGSGSAVVWANAGVTMADQWMLTSNFSPSGAVSIINSNWGRVSRAGYGSIGSAMTQSSGIFTYPQTGIYFVEFTCQLISTSAQRYLGGRIQTTHNNTNYAHAADVNTHCGLNNTYGTYSQVTCSVIQDVQDVTQDKVRFCGTSFTPSDTTLQGDANRAATHVTFIRLGDT